MFISATRGSTRAAKAVRYLASASLTASILFAAGVGGAAAEPTSSGSSGPVFVQSNDPVNNQVLAYERSQTGELIPSGSYSTGGVGGRLGGSPSFDPLASQGSLRFDSADGMLIGVNSGSNTVYTFHVDGDRLTGLQVLASGGDFPVSVTIHNDLVYVLNARGSGTVYGYRIQNQRLWPITDSGRSLGITPNPTSTEFLTTPGQVGFTPDGRQLVVVTKASGNHIDVFQVGSDGQLSPSPVVSTSTTPVPFAFTFEPQDQLVVTEAASSHVSTYQVHPDGTVTPIGTATDDQHALCWVVRDHDAYVVSNAASQTMSSFRLADGQPKVLATTPVGAAPTEITVTPDQQFLYVTLGGAGTTAALQLNPDGSLRLLGTFPGQVGEEGIVAP